MILRALPVWQRNVRVWSKMFFPSLLGSFGEPLMVLLALGFGLGAFIKTMDGLSYHSFIASGFLCASSMLTASIEGCYACFTRMQFQQIWHAMRLAPLSMKDIVLGELLWIGSKCLFSSLAISIVASLLGLIHFTGALMAMPVLFLSACCFGAMALIATSLAKNYDFFMYYFNIITTPMMLISGVYFPLDKMPIGVQTYAHLLPLSHVIAIVRPLVTEQPMVPGWPLHLAVLLAYTGVAVTVAVVMLQRRVAKGG